MSGPAPDRPLRAGADPEEARFAVVMLHGRGAGARDLMPLADALAFDDGAYLFPQAPGNSWYPFGFLEPLERNEPALSEALRQIGEIVAGLVDAGLGTERICLLGFSQGACLSCEYAARNPVRYGGIFALSGGLAGPSVGAFPYRGDLAGTPVFLGCGDPDPFIPRERVEETGEVLARMGAKVDVRIYPGIGHGITDDEIAAVRDSIGKISG